MFNSTPDTNSKEHENLRQEMLEIRKNLQNLSKILENQTAVPPNPDLLKIEVEPQPVKRK
jgi:hypothetical protein